ncbi:MAG: hypothetical protein WCK18_01275 [Prolixibacteraceae bacterium]
MKNEEDFDLSRNIEQFSSIHEIYLWREMVLRDEMLFLRVYKLISSDNPKVAWHAAWLIDHASEADPSKLEPYINELIERLPNLTSSSLKRHFTRMLIKQEIPEEKLGQMVDVLYHLMKPSEAIAVQANALQLLYQIAMKEPDLKGELIYVLETMMEEGQSRGMMSKGRKILKALRNQ